MSRTYRATPWCRHLKKRKHYAKCKKDGVAVSYGCSNKTGRKNHHWQRVDRMFMDTRDRLLYQALASHHGSIDDFKRKSGFWNEGHELTTQEKRKKIDQMETMLGVGFKCCIAGDGPTTTNVVSLAVADHVTAGVVNGYKIDIEYDNGTALMFRRNRKEMVKLIYQMLFNMFPYFSLILKPLKYMVAGWYYKNRSIWDPIASTFLLPKIHPSILRMKVQDFLSGQIGFKASRSVFLYETPYETWNKLMAIQRGIYLDNEIRYQVRGEYSTCPGLPPEMWNEIMKYLREDHEVICAQIDHESRYLTLSDESEILI